jgi:hypothetical protein
MDPYYCNILPLAGEYTLLLKYNLTNNSFFKIKQRINIKIKIYVLD